MSAVTDWDTFVRAHPQGNILQTSAWGRLKAAFGWETAIVHCGDQGALVLLRPLFMGWKLAYIPRGPLADWNSPEALQTIMPALDELCRARHVLCLKIEPDVLDTPAIAATLRAWGFQPTPHTVQPPRTILVDLSGSEAEVLARMKHKTRYNIALASRKNVTVRPARNADEVTTFAALLRLTAARDGFGVHTPDYYRRAYELFHPLGECELFLAEYVGEALAGVMVFGLGKRAWYFYGASSHRERQRMAPYRAQWAAMCWARARGAQVYDLWGIPDADEATLEAQFEQRRDGLWGVYRAKRGYGGRVVRLTGAWDKAYHHTGYRFYQWYLRFRLGRHLSAQGNTAGVQPVASS